MNNQSPNYPLTMESLMASIEASNRYLTEQRVENERYLKEQLAETRRFFKEMDAETRRLFDEAKVKTEIYREKTERDREKTERDREDYERRMKKMEKLMGSWANNHGNFAEEYFANSFEEGRQNFFGEEFDDMEKKAKGFKKGFKDEYDIVLINGKTICIIEVKYKAHEKDLPKVMKKAYTFRINFPEYEQHQIYLGLATLAFYPELEQACIEEGIAIIKQVGDTVVIRDENIKVF